MIRTTGSSSVTGWGVEFGTISGNWTDFDCSVLLIDDDSVIERVIVGGFKRLTGRCND